MKCALGSRKALTDHRGIFIDQYRHLAFPLRGSDRLFSRLIQIVGGDDSKPALSEERTALLYMGTFQANHYGDRDAHFFDRLDNASGDQIAADDATEDIHQDRLHTRVRHQELKSLRDPLGGGATAYVKKVGRSSPVELNDIHSSHGKSCAVDHATDIAVEADIVEIITPGYGFFGIFLGGIAPFGERRLPK